MPNENAAVDFNVPPLAAVTGVVGLRNGEEVPVLTTGCRIAPRDGSNRNWARHGGVYGDVDGRHPEDIVAQVSVGPTGPGVYETVDGGSCDIIGRDEGGWYVANRLLRRDDFGRCFNRSRSIRVATGDLRRRIGDLPEPDAVPAEVQEFAAKTAESYREACERLLGIVRQAIRANSAVLLSKDNLPHLLVALASAVGKRDEPADEPIPQPEVHAVVTGPGVYRSEHGWGWRVVPVGDGWGGEGHSRPSWLRSGAGVAPEVPALVQRVGGLELWDPACVHDTSGPWSCCKPNELAEMIANYTERVRKADEGRAAMDAIWGEGVPTVDQRTRDWLREMVREFVAADVSTNRQGFVVTATPERFTLSEAEILPVSRADLRVLFEAVCASAFEDHWTICPEIGEPTCRALSRAAAALGDVEVPDWMLEHARKEGWT